MSDYNVKEVARLLKIDEETVRRWIRSGKLEAQKNSKKEGFVVTQESLDNFLKKMPKYSGMAAGIAAAASPAIGLPIIAGWITGALVANFAFQKNTKVTGKYIEDYLKKEIRQLRAGVVKKRNTIAQLESDIEGDEKRIKDLLYALKNLDMENLADEINNGR